MTDQERADYVEMRHADRYLKIAVELLRDPAFGGGPALGGYILSKLHLPKSAPMTVFEEPRLASDVDRPGAWTEWIGPNVDDLYFWRRILVDRWGQPKEEVEKMTEDEAASLADNWESDDGG